MCLALLSGCGGGGSSGSTSTTSTSSSGANSLIANFPPHVNAAYVYDFSPQDKPLKAGSHAAAINCYNNGGSCKASSQPTPTAHQIRMVYSYGGDLEISTSCSDASTCPMSDFWVDYNAKKANTGIPATKAYANDLTFGKDPSAHFVAPVVDGSFYSPYLKQFSTMDKAKAQAYADKTARTVCADDNVDGIEFDVEPFGVKTKNAQYYYYMEIARDFAGGYSGNATSPGCVDKSHPDGRFFGVFASPQVANTQNATAAKHLQSILTTYGNGYLVAALYDLAGTSSGTLTSPSRYAQLVTNEVSGLKQWAKTLGINYAFAVPGGASAHEFTTVNGTYQGYPMLDYTRAAMKVINSSGIKSGHHYMGTDLWFWGPMVKAGSESLGPAAPPGKVLHYLAGHM